MNYDIHNHYNIYSTRGNFVAYDLFCLDALARQVNYKGEVASDADNDELKSKHLHNYCSIELTNLFMFY